MVLSCICYIVKIFFIVLVTPNWSTWGDWGECNNSVKCGDGYQERNKTCITSNCLAAGVENKCVISFGKNGLILNETQACTENCTVVNGTWSQWTVWSNCSSSCGVLGGETIRTRTCEGILNGGSECLKTDNVTRAMHENQTMECFYYCPSK